MVARPPVGLVLRDRLLVVLGRLPVVSRLDEMGLLRPTLELVPQWFQPRGA